MKRTGVDSRPLHEGSEDPSERRTRIAEEIANRLHGPVSVLGIVFVLVVIGESLARPGSTAQRVFVLAGWALWSLFAIEFALRLVIAPSTKRFLRRNWWQLVFLVVPFLRFLALLRVSRAARAVTSGVRAGRGASAKLTGRLGWLVGVTVIVILSSANLLVEVGGFSSMAAAMRAATVATLAGEPTGGESGFAQALDVVLVAYSVVVFATLAGALGAYFLERPRETTLSSTKGQRQHPTRAARCG